MELPWMKLYVGTIAGNIAGLSLEECGAYLKLIVSTWQRGPIPVAVAGQLLGKELETFSPIFSTLLTVKNGVLSVDAVESERGSRIGKRKQSASAANARWSKERMRTHEAAHSVRNAVEGEGEVEVDGKGEGETEKKEREAPIGASAKTPDLRISRLVEHLKSVNGGAIDGGGTARRDCSTLLKQMERDFPDFDGEKSVRTLIDRSKAHSWHGPKTTSFGYLVRHRMTIINELKEGSNGKRTSVDPAQVHRNIDETVDRLVRDGYFDSSGGK